MSKLDEMKKEAENIDEKTKLINEIQQSLEPEQPTSKEPEKKTEPKKTMTETQFNDEDKVKLINKRYEEFKKKGIKLRRQEKSLLKNLEHDPMQKTRWYVMIIAVIGIMVVGLMRNMLPSDALFTIIILMGMMLFFPIGMIAGWIVFDPIMRTKMLRRVTRRNWGYVFFVGKGMKAVGKTKDFDKGLIWKDNECWVLTKDKIAQMTKDGNTINEGKSIDPNSIITLVDTVPVIFVDLDSMEPLMLHQEGRIPVYPGEIGPSLKAWVDNQRAKMMALKKTQDILMLIAVIAACAAVVVSFLVMNKVDTMQHTINLMEQQLTQLTTPSMTPP